MSHSDLVDSLRSSKLSNVEKEFKRIQQEKKRVLKMLETLSGNRDAIYKQISKIKCFYCERAPIHTVAFLEPSNEKGEIGCRQCVLDAAALDKRDVECTQMDNIDQLLRIRAIAFDDSTYFMRACPL